MCSCPVADLDFQLCRVGAPEGVSHFILPYFHTNGNVAIVSNKQPHLHIMGQEEGGIDLSDWLFNRVWSEGFQC